MSNLSILDEVAQKLKVSSDQIKFRRDLTGTSTGGGTSSWDELEDIPAGFADGVDNVGVGNVDSAWMSNWNDSYSWGNHSGLYALVSHTHYFNYSGYDNDLNTTDSPTFVTIDTGEGANELFDMDQNVMTSSDVEFENLTVDDTLDMSNGGTTWNIYVNATGVLVWEME